METKASQTADQTKSIVEKFQIVEGITGIEFSFEGASRTRDVIIVLDISGSMCGNPITEAKKGITNLISEIRTTSAKCELIVYNVTATEIVIDANYRSVVDNIRSNGGTMFSKAFEALKNVLLRRNNPVSVIFFTDGRKEDYETIHDITFSMAMVASIERDVEYHTIGLGGYHDAPLLSEITRMGKAHGTYQYCSTSGVGISIDIAIANLAQITTGNIKAVAEINNVEHKLNLKYDDSTNMYTSRIFLKNDCSTTSTVVTFDNKNVFVVELTQIEPTVDRIVKARIDYFNLTLQDIADKIKSLPNAALVVSNLDKLIDETANLVRSQKIIVRKRLMPYLLDMKKTIAEFTTICRDIASTGINNDRIASLNSIAFRGTLKQGTQKKLDQRCITNVDLFNRGDQQIEKAVANINFGGENLEWFPDICALSTSNYIEAIQDSDCMGIALSIKRSPVAVVDPSRLEITTIRPTFLCVESFLEAAEYAQTKALNQPINQQNTSFNYGETGVVIKGVDGEPISGILPLYISPAHWSVAKHKIKPIMGWMCTLDPLGYAYSQIKIVPFSVLSIAIRDLMYANTEHTKRMYGLILDTCKQIFTDGFDYASADTLNWTQEIINLFSEYNNNPAVRGTDKIPSNRIFFAQVHVAIELGLAKFDQEYMTLFISNMIAEQYRRTTTCATPEIAIKNILNVDEKYYIPHIAEAEKQMTGIQSEAIFIEKFVQAGGSKMKEVICEKNTENNNTLCNIRDDVLNPYQFVYNTRADRSGIVKHAIDMVTDFAKLYHCELPVVTNSRLAALQIQSLLCPTNQALCLYTKSGLFHSAFTTEGETTIITREIVNFVEREICAGKQKITARFNRASSEFNASVFGRTTDLIVAAGALLGSYIGTDFMYFVRELQRGGCPLAFEKALMIINGKYKGIMLLGDIETLPFHRWIPSKQNHYRLLNGIGFLTAGQESGLFPHNQRSANW